MTDARRDELAGDRLPWLEAVEEDEEQGGPSLPRLIGAIVIGLVAIGVVVGGAFWYFNPNRAEGNGEIIAAPEGDYKVRPDEPGGLNVSSEGDMAAAASAGAEPQGRIDTNAVAEAPITRPQPAPPAPQARPKAPPPARPAPPPARPQPAPAARGTTIQLGAFSTPAGATTAWRALSGRFSYLAPLGHSVIPVQTGGRTLYRLRASGPDAAGVCRRLQVAGEDCAVVG